MAGSHRANAMTIHILRTSVIQSNADIKRPKSYEYRVIIINKIILGRLNQIPHH